MKVRKIVAGLAAVSMLAAVSAQAVFAADQVTITGDKVTAAAGEQFTLNVELSGVPAAGISVCEFALTYDASLVTVDGVTAGAIVNADVDSAEQFEGATAFESDYETTAGVINVTYTTGLEDTAYWITTDGVFLTITGTVNAEAAAGSVAEFAIGAIERETTEGSGVTNAEICIGNVGADYVITQYESAVDNGSVTVADSGVEQPSTEDNTTPSEDTNPSEDTTPSEDTGEVLYGDVNCDGAVTILDVIQLNKNLLAGEALSDQGIKNADVDQDTKPSVTDSMNILKYVIKMIDKLPV